MNVITEGVPSGNWGGMTSATWVIEVGHQLQVTCTIAIWNYVTCIWLASRLDSSLVSWFNQLQRTDTLVTPSIYMYLAGGLLICYASIFQEEKGHGKGVKAGQKRKRSLFNI